MDIFNFSSDSSGSVSGSEEDYEYYGGQNPSWITKNIHMRECIRFTEAPPPKGSRPDNPKCYCGKTKQDHEERYRENPQPHSKWKESTHTQICATNAYGEIEFVGAPGSGFGQNLKLKKFVRVDHASNPTKIFQLMKDQWNLQTPKLLISVTGGARDFPLNSRLKDVFRKGLISAARSTGAWILTGGTHAGVMKYVGEAVRDYDLAGGDISSSNVVAIGIATWGVLDQREQLIDERGKWPASYRMDNPNPRGVKLDPNHTHFILVDNGTVGKFGAEIKLRGKIEKEISEQKVAAGETESNVSVPVVCVVVEGGPNTIYTVYEAIKNGTPAVIVAGSGRAADLLAFAFQKARTVTKRVRQKGGTVIEEKRIVLSEAIRVKVAAMLVKEFGEKDLDVNLNRIQECVKYPHLINVYELDRTEGLVRDIDSAILHALLRANKGGAVDQLQLALIWNRVDVAKRELFTDDREWKKGELDTSLHFAITNDLVNFVDLIMDNGISMKDFLTDRELTLLYSEVKSSTLLHDILFKQYKNSKDDLSLHEVGKIIQSFTMDTYSPLYLREPSRFRTTVREHNIRFNESNTALNQVDTAQLRSLRSVYELDHNPLRELFLYAILLNREEMARLFWNELDEAIEAALTASLILKSMASKENDFDQCLSLNRHAETYEELATGVLNECYSEDEVRTLLMLVRELPNWGYTTCLSLAVQAENKSFIAHSCVQNLLTQIWMGKISEENSQWKLWLTTLFPPCIPFLVWFREDTKHNPENHAAPPQRSESSDVLAVYNPTVGEGVNMVALPSDEANGRKPPSKRSTTRSKESYKETGGIDIRDSGQSLSVFQRFKLFYTAPMIKFRHSVVSYFAFLFLFSYIILTSFDVNITWMEWLLIAWVLTLYSEEFRQIAQGESKSWKYRFRSWITNYWNMLDIATLLMFSAGVVLRFFPGFLGAARIILALDLMIFYIRLLQSFSVSKNLGPKLIMIAKMMVDLVFFVCILFVFLIAYGIASFAIMFPNTTDPATLFKGIFFQSYFQIYGELFLEDIQGDGCTNDTALIEAGLPLCPQYSWIGITLLAFYMIISNVLLLNLLIAMFSYTFSNIQDNTDLFWKFQRYDVINEYFSRPPLPPPLIIISHLYFVIRFCFRKTCCGQWKTGKLKQKLAPDEVKQFMLWEGIISDNYISKEKLKVQEDINERVKSTGDGVRMITSKVEQLLSDSEAGGRVVGGGGGHGLGGKYLEKRLARIEDQVERACKAMDWIILALTENKLGRNELPKLKDIKPREAESDESSPEDGEEESVEVPTTLEELGIAIHTKARASPYPGTAIRRFHVPDNFVPWDVDFPQYKPTKYTHPNILKKPHYADDDILSLPKDRRPVLRFNEFDALVNYNRESHMGHYRIIEGIPQNPKGRTGVVGRGLLGRFGPNHAADPVVTRWKKDNQGGYREDCGKRILEFISIQRVDNKQWAIPGGMVEPGHKVSQTLIREFSEEALGELDKTEEERQQLHNKVTELFEKRGKEIYKGYVDDPRNTDNAWMETVAMNFHDEDGTVFKELEELLQAGDDAEGVRWQRVSSKIQLFASHTAILARVAEMHNAAF